MSFYFGIPPTNTQQVISISLRERGINYLRAAPSMLKLQGLHSITQPGFSAYTACLPAAMHATFTQQDILVSAEGYPISLPIDSCFPIPPVSVNFNFQTPNIPEAYQQTLHELGANRQQLDGRNKSMYIIPDATPGTIRELRKLTGINSTTASPVQCVNLQAYNQLMVAIRIFSAFFRTHTYPAFIDSLHASTVADKISESAQKRKLGNPTSTRTTTARMEGQGDVTRGRVHDVTELTISEVDVKLYKVYPSESIVSYSPGSSNHRYKCLGYCSICSEQ